MSTTHREHASAAARGGPSRKLQLPVGRGRRPADARVEVAVSADCLSAFLCECRSADGGGRPLDAAGVHEALRRADVVVPPDPSPVAQAVRLVNAGVDARGLIVARATAPRPGRDGHLEPVCSSALWGDGQVRSLREPRAAGPVLVREGELLARVVPPEPGIPGCDVRGRPLPACGGRRALPVAGENVALAAGGLELRSLATGLPLVRGARLSVARAYEVPGDVDSRSGDLLLDDVSVMVSGSIRSGRTVSCGRHLLVAGRVEQASLRAGGDVRVGRGARLGHTGCIEAGGSIAVRRAESGCLQAGRDVESAEGITDCRVVAGGSVRCVGGTGWIAGSEVRAGSGIEADEAGSGLTRDTRLVIGMAPDALPALQRDERATALARLTLACRRGLKVRGILHPGTIVEIAGQVRTFDRPAVRVRVYSDGPGLPVRVAAL